MPFFLNIFLISQTVHEGTLLSISVENYCIRRLEQSKLDMAVWFSRLEAIFASEPGAQKILLTSKVVKNETKYSYGYFYHVKFKYQL